MQTSQNKFLAFVPGLACLFCLTSLAQELPRAPKIVEGSLRPPVRYQKIEGAKEEETRYDNGQVFARGQVRDDEMVGVWQTYHTNASLMAVGEMKGEKRLGFWVFYHPDGARKSDGMFDDFGRPKGIWRIYYPNGSLYVEGGYENGRETGEWRQYGTNGYLNLVRRYEEGRLEGPYTAYDDDGKVLISGRYEKGSQEGEWTITDPLSGSVMKGLMKGGFRCGKWLISDRKNNLELEYEYGGRGRLLGVVTNLPQKVSVENVEAAAGSKKDETGGKAETEGESASPEAGGEEKTGEKRTTKVNASNSEEK